MTELPYAALIAHVSAAVAFTPYAHEAREDVPVDVPQLARFRHEPTGLVFVLLPGGGCRLGTPRGEPGRGFGERRPRETRVEPFLLCETPCTQDAYARVTGTNPSHHVGAERPVDTVSFDAAVRFCERVGLRLPSEDEWEYACRAGSSSAYFHGDDPAELPRYALVERQLDATEPVRARAPNGFGLFAMLGNVMEWCCDPAGDRRQPCRGGSYQTSAVAARCGLRITDERECQSWDLGFRPAADLPPAPARRR